MKTTLATLLVLFCTLANAQTSVANFTLTDVINDKSVSLNQFSASPGVVILFTSNACPYDLYYTDRLKDLISNYSNRIPFLLINAHLDQEESEDKMKVSASGLNLSVPYLSDKEQRVMEMLGAKRTPEAFLLKHSNGNFTLVYSGALDDNAQEPGAVANRYLNDAIENLLTGKAMTQSQVRAVGCSIRKK